MNSNDRGSSLDIDLNVEFTHPIIEIEGVQSREDRANLFDLNMEPRKEFEIDLNVIPTSSDMSSSKILIDLNKEPNDEDTVIDIGLSSVENICDQNKKESSIENLCDQNRKEFSVENICDRNKKESSVENISDGDKKESSVENICDRDKKESKKESSVENICDRNKKESSVENICDEDKKESSVKNICDRDKKESSVKNICNRNKKKSRQKKRRKINKPPSHRIRVSSDAKNDMAATSSSGSMVAASQTGEIKYAFQQDMNSAIKEAKEYGGNFKAFETPYGNFLVPVLPTPEELLAE